MAPAERVSTEMGPESARLHGERLDLDRLAELLEPLGSPIRLRLLRFLTSPHYLEEVASHLKLTRQAARKHLDQLVAIRVLERRSGVRDSGPVTEYVLEPQAIFLIQDEFEKLGNLQPSEKRDALSQTMAVAGQRVVPQRQEGPCLCVVRGPSPGRRLPLSPDPLRTWTMGRDPRCEVLLGHDPFASNRHAEVRYEGGQFILTDLRSTNGTQHNWGAVPRGAEVVLRHGDIVGIGKTLLLFWDSTQRR